MPLPRVTVTATYVGADGTPARGRVIFKPLVDVVDAANNTIVLTSSVTATLDGNGSLAVQLVPSDAAGINPSPMAYQVTEQIAGADRTYDVVIPGAQPTVNLSGLVPVNPGPLPVASFQLVAERGIPNGYASLDSTGRVPVAQIPNIAFIRTHAVANQTAMLALTGVYPGEDLAVRLDGAGTYLLTGANPALLGSWQLLPAPTDAVTSVNGHTGTVVLTAADVGADPSGAAAAGDATTLSTTNGRAIAFAVSLGA